MHDIFHNIIRLDYDGVIKRAGQLDSIAQDNCAQLIRKTKVAMSHMDSAWKGNSGLEMQEVMQRRLDKLIATQKELQELSDMMRDAANKLKIVDDKLSSMFL